MNQQKVKSTLINWDLVSVNPNYKNWDWKDLFCFWGVNVQSIIGFSLIASLYTIYNLNTFVVFFGTILGSLLVFLFTNLIGKPSQKYSLPFVVILRSSLGFKGAEYFGLLRCFVGVFTFGVQTYFLSKAFSYLIRIFFFSIDSTILDEDIFLFFLLGLNIIDWLSFIFAILLQTFLFSIGINFNRKLIKISAITVYLGIILFFFVVFLNDVKLTAKAFSDILNFNNFFQINNLAPLFTVAGTIFAYFSIIIINFGDYSRLVKDDKELKKGNLSLILNLIIFSFLAVFIVAGTDTFLNENIDNIENIFTNPTDIIGKFDNFLITIIALFFIVFASASTNLVTNFIPAQYSMINFFPNKLTLKSSSYLIAIFSFFIGIFWLPLFSQIGILSIVDTVGSFFGPMFGIIVIDYYFIKKEVLNNKDIYSVESNSSYYFSGGWHLKAIYCLFLGFIFSSATIWNNNLMFMQYFSWILGALISSITYYLLAKD